MYKNVLTIIAVMSLNAFVPSHAEGTEGTDINDDVIDCSSIDSTSYHKTESGIMVCKTHDTIRECYGVNMRHKTALELYKSLYSDEVTSIIDTCSK